MRPRGDDAPAIACSTSATNARTTGVSSTNSPSIVSSIFARLRPARRPRCPRFARELSRTLGGHPALRAKDVIPWHGAWTRFGWTPICSGSGRSGARRSGRRRSRRRRSRATCSIAGSLRRSRPGSRRRGGAVWPHARRDAGSSRRGRSPLSRSSSARPRCCPSPHLRHGSAGAAGPLLEDPPSLTFRAGEFGFHLPAQAGHARPRRAHPRRAAVGRARVGLVATSDLGGRLVRRAPRRRNAAAALRAGLGHVGSRHGQDAERAVEAVRERADDQDAPLR